MLRGRRELRYLRQKLRTAAGAFAGAGSLSASEQDEVVSATRRDLLVAVEAAVGAGRRIEATRLLHLQLTASPAHVCAGVRWDDVLHDIIIQVGL